MDKNDLIKYTIKGALGNELIVYDDAIEIVNRLWKKRLKIKYITKFCVGEDDHKKMYISIKSKGVVIWGEQETVFYIPESEIQNGNEAVAFVNSRIQTERLDLCEDYSKVKPLTLKGQDDSIITADHKCVTIEGRFKEKTILMEDIKKATLIEDGKTVPFISITKRATILKWDSEYAFYYDDRKKAQEMVNYINFHIT